MTAQLCREIITQYFTSPSPTPFLQPFVAGNSPPLIIPQNGNPKLALLLAKFHQGQSHILNTKRQEEVSDKEDPFPYDSNIHPSPFRTPNPLPTSQNGIGLILEGQAPLVLTFPGFQERKHGVVSYPVPPPIKNGPTLAI